MKNVQKIDLGLTGYDELFANDEERRVNKLPRIFDIPMKKKEMSAFGSWTGANPSKGMTLEELSQVNTTNAWANS